MENTRTHTHGPGLLHPKNAARISCTSKPSKSHGKHQDHQDFWLHGDDTIQFPILRNQLHQIPRLLNLCRGFTMKLYNMSGPWNYRCLEDDSFPFNKWSLLGDMKKNGGNNYQEKTTTSFFNLAKLRITFPWNDGSDLVIILFIDQIPAVLRVEIVIKYVKNIRSHLIWQWL